MIISFSRTQQPIKSRHTVRPSHRRPAIRHCGSYWGSEEVLITTAALWVRGSAYRHSSLPSVTAVLPFAPRVVRPSATSIPPLPRTTAVLPSAPPLRDGGPAIATCCAGPAVLCARGPVMRPTDAGPAALCARGPAIRWRRHCGSPIASRCVPGALPPGAPFLRCVRVHGAPRLFASDGANRR